MELDRILREGVGREASDIHLKVGARPIFRVSGRLGPWAEHAPLTHDDMNRLCESLLTDFHRQRLREVLQVDAGYGHPDLGRFRVNVFHQRGELQAALRLIPARVRGIHDLNLPPVVERIAAERRGLVLVTGTISKSRTIVVFINQIRMKIGVMFGNPETTTGGNALKFYASVRLDIRRLGAIKHGDEVIGSRTKVRVVKNKVAPPFREAEFDILYGSGISKEGELIDIAAEHGIVEKTGAWYAFGGDRIGQGRENARDFLREHAEVAATIEAKVREKFGLKADAAPAAAEGNGASAEGAPAGEPVRRGRGGKE